MKIRSHLMILVLGAVLPLFAFSAAMTTIFWREQRRSVEERFLERVRAMSIALDRELDGQIEVLNVLAQSELLRSANIKEFYEYARRVRDGQKSWSTFIVADPSGQQLINVAFPYGTLLPTLPVDGATVKKVVTTGQLVVSSLFKDPATNHFVAAILLPVKLDETVTHVLAAVIESSSWLEFLGTFPAARDAMMTLLDQNGLIVARTLNNATSVGRYASSALLENSRQTIEAAYPSVGLEGQDIYTAHSRSKLSGWTVATGVPQNAVERGLRDSMLAMAAGATAALLLAVGLALLFGRQIARSVSGLTRFAHALTDGKPAEPMAFSNVAEVNEVAEAFEAARTERHFRESALRRSEEKFRALTSHAPVGIFLTDLKGDCIFVNQSWCAMAGLSAEQAQGAGWRNAIHPEDRERVLAQWDTAVRRRFPFRCEYRFLRQGGSVTWLQASAVELTDLDDSAIGHIGTVSNISELKLAEEALRASEDRLRQQASELEQQLIASGRLVSLGEVTASMAHEFNNPLGIVMGFVQELIGETNGSDPRYQSLKIIDEETKRCQRIIQELLQFSRPGNIEFSLTNIREVVDKTLAMVKNHLFKQQIESIVEMEENLPRIHADHQQLEQVLLNLYLNAIDAMPNGGKLTVKVRLEPQVEVAKQMVITVADSGIGIEKDDLHKIFQPFFTAKKRRGLGLGLSICQRIIKNHNGRIEVQSEVGNGTTFAIYLDLQRAPDSADRAEPTETQRV